MTGGFGPYKVLYSTHAKDKLNFYGITRLQKDSDFC